MLFQAYMESTCLDGSPNYLQKILSAYLRNFKECVVNNFLQKRRSTRFLCDITKYALTIGLSGFIILLITWFKESGRNNQVVEQQQAVLKVFNDISNSARTISDASIKINENLEAHNEEITGYLKLMNSKVSENAAVIKEEISTLKEIIKTENSKGKNTDK